MSEITKKEKVVFTPCLFYTSALILSFIFSMLFLRTTKTPVYIIDEITSSINELDKKIEKNTIAGVKKYGSSETISQEEIKQIKNELMSVRDKITDIKMKVKSKTWAN